VRRPVRPVRRRSRKRPLLIVLSLLLVGAGIALAPSAIADWRHPRDRRDLGNLEVQSLDGNGNNRFHPDWGKVGQPYDRVAPANYADGHSQPVAGPNTRFLSNRIFNDVNQNVFSENRISQWGWVWGQFLDHTFGLRDDRGTAANIPFDKNDPLESFTDSLGVVPFTRSAAAPGTGVTNPRQQINTVSSYIDAWPVYGGTNERLEWLREGPVDGNMRNNSALLLLPGGLLPRRDSRGDAATAPQMATDGRLVAQPARAAVAGDVRANENIGLTAVHTLFAREHNRIVSRLPGWMSQEQKFQIARRVIIAEQQYITYREWLPALGVNLPEYRGYNPRTDPSLTNEFATVGYRAHSMIHGEMEIEAAADRYTAQTLEAIEAQGIEVEKSADGEDVDFAIPLGVAFFNPDLVGQIQLGPLVEGLSKESEYNNDEQIDNQLRSTMFQIPVAGNTDCLDGPSMPECFTGVLDVGALDVERGRDHGMPSYNDLRKAYGLPAKFSFTEITGESTDAFPAGLSANDPHVVDVTNLWDVKGEQVELGSDEAKETPVKELRRTTKAARLKAVYGSVDKVDAFVGMIAEPHVNGADMGELQQAIWRKQFQALRDGDRFFYGNDPGLSVIRRYLGIDYRHSLADIIALNTDIRHSDLANNVFILEDEPAQPAAPAPAATTPGAPVPTTPPGTPAPGTSTAARRHGRSRRVPAARLKQPA
jgi:hypothetical protein